MAADKKGGEESQEIIYQLEFHPQFQNDLQDAFDYYEEKQAGLGEEFMLAIEESLGWIESNPLFFQKIYKNKRKVNTQKFPYGIIYFVKGEAVYITIAIHLHRNPSIWKSRRF